MPVDLLRDIRPLLFQTHLGVRVEIYIFCSQFLPIDIFIVEL